MNVPYPLSWVSFDPLAVPVKPGISEGRRRMPKNSCYCQCVQDHFGAFEQVYEDRFERGCQLDCVAGIHTGTLSPNRMTN
jgi:hypothetical protein